MHRQSRQSGRRIGEALGLEIGKHLSDDCSIVLVRQQRSKNGGGIEPFPKTDAGFRDVDLDPALALLLKNYLGGRQNGPLFRTSSGLTIGWVTRTGKWQGVTASSC
jgi:integrase